MTTTEQIIDLLRSHDNRSEIPDILFQVSHEIKQDQEKRIHDLMKLIDDERMILTKLKRL